MKNKFTLLLTPLVVFVLYITLSSSSGGITGQSVVGCTCHNATASPNTVVTLTGLPAGGYVNGTVYSLTLSVTNTVIVASAGGAGLRDGFDMTVTSGAFTAVAGTTLNTATEIRHNTPKASVSGTASWTFNWTAPASGGNNVTFAVAGNATNGDGAAGTPDSWNQISTTIYKSGAVLAVAATGSTIACNGGVSTITATGSGPTVPYQYKLNAGAFQSGATFSGNIAGTYTITVKDATAATATTLLTISQPTLLTFNAPTLTPPICNGGTGSASITAINGTGTRTYTITPLGPQSNTTGNFTGLTSQNYTVTVTDGNSCIKTTTFNLTQPSLLTFSAPTLTPPLCNGGTGSASITAINGTGTRTYTITPLGPQSNTTGNFTGLTSQSYTVTVTDGNNCIKTTTFNLTQPTLLTFNTPTLTPPLCNGGTGNTTITAVNGTGTKTYTITPLGPQSNTTGNFTGLTSQLYTVTVTDGNLCTKTSIINLTQPGILTFTAPTLTPPLCNGGTGSASINAINGTGTKTYTISPLGPQSNTTGNFTGLTSQLYTVTVTDGNLCTKTTTISIGQPNLIQLNTLSISNPICNGGTGSASMTSTGGTGTITYTINPLGPQSNTNGIFSGLIGQTYTITATDANACTKTTTITLLNPSPITASASNVNGCSGNPIVLSGSPAGGTFSQTSPYTGPSTTYTYTYTDGNGCTATSSPALITVTTAPSFTLSPINICGNSASAGATVNFISLPYTLNITTPYISHFSISGAVFGPSLNTVPLSGNIHYFSNPDLGCNPYPAGTFAGKIALIDRGTCTFEAKAFNAQLAGAVGVIIVNNIPGAPISMGAGGSLGVNIPTIMVSQSDGLLLKNLFALPSTISCNTSANSLLWNTGAVTSSINGLSTNVYSAVVTDVNTCSASQSVQVYSNDYPTLQSSTTPECNGSGTGTALVHVINDSLRLHISSPSLAQFAMRDAVFGPNVRTQPLSGDIVYYSNPDLGCNQYPSNTFTGKIALIDRGVCPFELKTYNAQLAGAIGVIIVNNVAAPIFTMGAVNQYPVTIPAVMISQSDGLTLKNLLTQPLPVTCNATTYTYLWNTSASTSTITNLSAGSFSVTVADGIGCTSTSNVEVSNVILQIPTITSIGKSSLCGDSVVLSASGSGSAIQFNGVDQWVDLGTDITNLNTANFTIETWLKTTGINEGIVVSSNNNSTWEPGERAFYIDTFGRPAFVGYGNNFIFSTVSVNDGNWHHVAVTWDYASSIGKMYIDGIEHSQAVSYTANAFSNIGSFSIGRPNFVEAPNYFSGALDELKIWNTARTQTDIQTSMYNSTNTNAFGLRSYYQMDENGGLLTRDVTSGYNGTLVNSPTWTNSNAFGYSYLWNTNQTSSNINVNTDGSYNVTITSPFGCSATSDPFSVVQTSSLSINVSGPTTFCSGDSVTLSIDELLSNKRFATSVIGFSSQFNINPWGALQSLGQPNAYPNYGDISTAWASSSQDDQREYLELGFANPYPINFIDIYETFAPGSVDTVYVKNPTTGLFEIVYSNPASVQPPVSRIMHISFPTTAFPVSEIRIAMNSIAVPDWNEIDAVGVGLNPAFLWSNGATTPNLTVHLSGSYYVAITQENGCSDTLGNINVTTIPCGTSLHLNLFIEGYYVGAGAMSSVLMNQGISGNNLLTDSVEVELHDQNAPFALIESVKTILFTDGTLSANFNASAGSYYIAVKHRNGNYTWSASPVAINALPVLYDFTTSSTQAFGDNMTEVEPGIWAFYSGDLNFDENIDLLDIAFIETDINNFEFGYFATDLNGDGNVDLLDSPILETNVSNFIFSQHP